MPPATRAPPAAAPQVLAILNTINKQTRALTNSTNWSVLATDFGSAAQHLQALAYPEAAQSDAKAFVAILEKLQADAIQVPSAGTADFTKDLGPAHADSDALRHDLGLTPAPVS